MAKVQCDYEYGRIIISPSSSEFFYSICSGLTYSEPSGAYQCYFKTADMSSKIIENIKNNKFSLYKFDELWESETWFGYENGDSLNIYVKSEQTEGLTEKDIKLQLSILDETNNFYLLRKDLSKPIWQGRLHSTFQFSDNNIEQGLQYKYNFIKANDYFKPIQWQTVKSDFEDIFLSDEDHLLRIRYNPKVSSFKTTVAEQKTDTIGSKYPFFFRNGNLGYKELPISGLISYHMDDLMLFDTSLADEYGVAAAARQETADTSAFANRTPADEVYLERKYKRKIMEWLNNGQPKLFRSATEGNFIVRLMNVSLSPNDTLGRRLHTFSATAYEVNDYGEEGLERLGVLSLVKNAPFYYQYPILKDGDYIPIGLDNSQGAVIDLQENTEFMILGNGDFEENFSDEILIVNGILYKYEEKGSQHTFNAENDFQGQRYIIVRTIKYPNSYLLRPI